MSKAALHKLRDSEQQTAIGRELINLLLQEGDVNSFQREREAPRAPRIPISNRSADR